MTRWQLIWLAVKILCRLLFHRDISAVLDIFAPKVEPVADAVETVAAKAPQMAYDVIKSRLTHIGILVLAFATYAAADGYFNAYDGLTKINKRISGGTGISIANGVITATGSAVIDGSIPFANVSAGTNTAYLGKNAAASSANAYKGNSAPSATEFSRLAGVTAPIQWQISSVRVTVESKPDLSNVTPSMNGIALAGTGPTASRVDHVHPVDTSREPANANIQAHISSTSNPHSVTKSQIGLGNVDNTSDLAKPISTATQTALNLKANITSLATVATTGSYTDLTNKPAVYTLPTASTTVKGGVKVDGTSIVVDGNGVISSTVSAGVSTVNGGTGDVTVTPANIGAAALAAFTNYTSVDRVTKTEYDAAAARSIPKTGTFTASLDTFLAIYGTAAVTLPSIPSDGFAHFVGIDTGYKTNALTNGTVGFGGTTFYVDGAASTSYTLPLKGSTVFSNYSGTWHGSTRATAAQGARADVALQSANYPVKNVLALGVLNNGSDQGTAIQALFDAAVNNDTFYFPKGNYGTTVQLKLPSDKMIRIIGDGPGATTFTALAALRSVFLKEGSRIEGIEFRDFLIEGNVPSYAQIGITLRSGVETKIENVYIARTSEAALAFGIPTAWDSSKTYHQYQYVAYSGHIFRSLQNTNLNHTPTIGSDSWWTDLETYDVSSNGLIYDTRMKSVTLRSANSPTQGLFGIHQYASANDNWIGNCIIANYSVANIFDEAGYTFYHKVYMNGSPLSSSPTYGIWSVTQFNTAAADAGITVEQSYFDGIGPTGGGGAAIRLDKGGNLITSSTFYRGSTATTNAGVEMKNGITRTTIASNRFDNVVPVIFQSNGSYGTEYNFTGNIGGLSPGSTTNIINSVAVGTAAIAGLGSVTNDAQLKVSQLVTSVGSPGSDTSVPSEKAVRSAIAASSGGLVDPGSDGIVKRTSLNTTGVAAASDIVALFGSGACSGYLKNDGTCGTTAGMVYPGAGVPLSTGSAWGTSYTVGTSANNLVQLNGSGALPAVSGANLTSLPSQVNVSALTLTSSSTSATAGVTIQRGNADFASGSAYDMLNVGQTFTAAAPAGGSSMRALNVNPFYSGAGTLPTLYGAFLSPRNTGTGTISSIIGVNVWPRNTSSGTVSGMSGLYLQAPSNSGTITGAELNGIKMENYGLSGAANTYGIQIADQSGSTNNYAIKTGAGLVSFGDRVTAKTFTGTIPTATTYGATTTIDLSLGDSPSVTLAGNPTLAFSNPVAGQWHILELIQDATGGRTVTWPSSGLVCTWRNADGTTTAPTQVTTANSHAFYLIHTKSTTAADCFAR